MIRYFIQYSTEMLESEMQFNTKNLKEYDMSIHSDIHFLLLWEA